MGHGVLLSWREPDLGVRGSRTSPQSPIRLCAVQLRCRSAMWWYLWVVIIEKRAGTVSLSSIPAWGKADASRSG